MKYNDDNMLMVDLDEVDEQAWDEAVEALMEDEEYLAITQENDGISESISNDIDVIAGIVLDHGERMVNGLRHVMFTFAGNVIDICQTKDGRLEVCEMDPSDFSYSHGDIHTYAPFEVSGFREKLEDKYTK